MDKQYKCFKNLKAELAKKNFHLSSPDQCSPKQKKQLKKIFNEEIFPVLTPLAVEEGKSLPISGNAMTYIALRLHEKKKPKTDDHMAIIQVPASNRFRNIASRKGHARYVLSEEIIATHAESLFPGYKVKEYLFFRVTRDTDLSVDEERDDDFVEAMEEVVISRRQSSPIRLEVSTGSSFLRDKLISKLKLDEMAVYDIDGPLDLKSFFSILFELRRAKYFTMFRHLIV